MVTVVPESDIREDQVRQFDQHVNEAQADSFDSLIQPHVDAYDKALTAATTKGTMQPADESGSLQQRGSYYSDPNFEQNVSRYRDRVEQLHPGLGDFAAAQSRLETGNGQQFSTPFNFGNIGNTDSNPKGGGGFPNPESAADAYVNFLTNNGGQTRYQALLDAAKQGGDVGTLATLAKQAGYATDPNYAQKLAAIAGAPTPARAPGSDVYDPSSPAFINAGPAGPPPVSQGGMASPQLDRFDSMMSGTDTAQPTANDQLGTFDSLVSGMVNPPEGMDVQPVLASTGLQDQTAQGQTQTVQPQATPETDPWQRVASSIRDAVTGMVPGMKTPSSPMDAIQNAAVQAGVPPAPDLSGQQSATDYATKLGEAAQHQNIVTPVGMYNPAFVPPNPAHGEEAPPGSMADSGLVREARGPSTLGGAGSPLAAVDDAFNQAPQSPSLGDQVQHVLNEAETQVADRLAALNRVGPRTEAAVATYAGRDNAAIQRATEDLKPVYDLVPSEADQRGLNNYIGLNRYIETANVTGNPNRLGAGGITSVADAQQRLADLEAAVGPQAWTRIQQADQVRAQALDRLLDDKVSTGFLTQEMADKLRTEQPHYNPTVVLDYLNQQEAAGLGAGNKLTQNSNLLKRLTEQGSASDQLSPMQAAIKAVVEGETNIRRNEVVKTLVTEGGFKVESPTSLVTGPLTKQFGERTSLAGTPATIVVKKQGDLSGYLSFWKDGKRMMAAVPPDVEKAAKAMTTEQVAGWLKVMNGLNQTLRLGATSLNPAFLATNAVRDYVSAFTREGISPLAVAKRYLPTAGTKALEREYIAAGGGMGTSGGYFARGANAQANVAKLEKQITSNGGLVVKSMGDVTRLAKGLVTLEPIRIAGERIEMGPRLATFEKYLNQGAAPDVAATAGRRVTVDFSRAGTTTKNLNMISPFLNARAQGVLNTARTLRDNPVSRARLGGLVAAVAGLYAYNRQFPEYADVPNYIKQNYGVVMLPGSEPNTASPGYKSIHYIAIPLGEWGAFAVPANAALEKIDGKNPGLMDTISSTVNAANPLPGNDVTSGAGGLVPPIVKAPIEVGLNKSFFTGQQIVPDSEKARIPAQQYGEQTTEAAKRLGAAFNVSPRQIDFGVREMTGGGGRLAMQAASTLMGQPTKAVPVVGGLTSSIDRSYGGQVQQDAYDNRDRGLKGLMDTNRTLYENFTRAGETIQAPPTFLDVDKAKIPLMPADQLRYQQARIEGLNKVMNAVPDRWERVAAMQPEQQHAALQEAMKLADEYAKGTVLRNVGGTEAKRRVVAVRNQSPTTVRAEPLAFTAP